MYADLNYNLFTNNFRNKGELGVQGIRSKHYYAVGI